MTQTAQYSIIPFRLAFAQQVSELVHQSVRQISHRRYSQAQLAAWSTKPRSAKHWQLRLRRSQAWLMLATNTADSLASQQPKVIGVINVETHFKSRGYIDSLYIAPAYQQQGLASQLYETLEKWARSQGYAELNVDASYLSKAFFIKQGFTLIQPSYQISQQQVINSFYLSKPLS